MKCKFDEYLLGFSYYFDMRVISEKLHMDSESSEIIINNGLKNSNLEISSQDNLDT